LNWQNEGKCVSRSSESKKDTIVITLMNFLILEYQSMMTLFMIPDAQLTFEETCE
jgi:hypothetical protein